MFLSVETTRRVFPGKRRTIVLSGFVANRACLLPLVCVCFFVCCGAYRMLGGL